MHISVTIILLMILSIMVSLTSALEPLPLGHGRVAQVINLDIGARNSAIIPHFESSGFAPPMVPQPMELDPGAMIYQSGKLRDESEAVHEKISALLNQTQFLTRSVEELESKARENANQSLQSAILAQNYFNRTRSVYNRTKISARKVEALVRRETKNEDFSNELETLRNQIIILEKRVDILEQRDR